MYQDRRPKFSPVREGEELDVKIEAVGEKGDGIAKKNGFVLFIPGVNEGDEVRIRVSRVLKKVGFAEKIGDAQGPIESSEPKQEKAYVPPPVAEPQPEDSEDFGDEDLDDEKDSEDLDDEKDSEDLDDEKDLEGLDDEKDSEDLDDEKDLEDLDDEKDLEDLDDEKDLEDLDDEKDLEDLDDEEKK
jgi:predicted RNA-binding protein with TRAM domain